MRIKWLGLMVSLLILVLASSWYRLQRQDHVHLYPESTIADLQFSEQETAWLKNHPIIKIGVAKFAPPYEYALEDGSLHGFTRSYLYLLEKSLGVKFEFVPADDSDQAYSFLREGKVLALSFVARNNSQGYEWLVSKPYAASSLGIFGPKGTLINNLDELGGEKIAIGRDTMKHRIIAKDNQRKYVPYDDVLEAMKAANRGEVKFYIGDILHSKFVIDKLEMSKLYYIAPVVGSAYEFGLAVEPKNEMFIKIVNQVFAKIDADMHLAIRTQWRDLEYLDEEFMINHYGRYMLWLIVAFAGVLGLVIYRNAQMQKRAQQMSQLQKMESLGRLAGGVAHDFNNMLAGIQGAAEFMKMQTDSGNIYRKYVDIIIKTCQRAAYLTSQLLVFSRDKEKAFSCLNLKEVVEDTVCLMEHGVSKKIDIETNFQEDKFFILGNKNFLQSLLLNLGFNAKDAMPDGGKITIGLQKKELDEAQIHDCLIHVPAGKYIELSVKDTGQGIPEKIIDNIFDPFFTTKEVGKGTGLGLAAVYGIVQEHHGTIAVQSSSAGTIFRVYFPEQKEESCVVAADEKVRKLSGRILVLDDEKILLELLKDILNSLGCEVAAYSSAEDLLANYGDGRNFDVVMLDVIMPKMSGTEVYEKLRGINPDVRVIFMSGYSKDYEIERIVKENNKVEFVKKPYSLQELSHKLAKIL